MPDFIFGRQPVLEALKAGTRGVHKIWLQTGTGGPGIEQIVQLARQKGVPLEWSDKRLLEQKLGSAGGHHQGVLAQASAVAFQELDTFLSSLDSSSSCLILALDEIQDPQNIGAILRSAAFFGVAAAIVPRWRSAPVGDTAARISSGALEHVPMIRVRNLAESIVELQEAGFEVIGADMAGEPLSAYTPSRRAALVMGSEGEGLRRLVKERCDKLIGIPALGKVASLNVSAAAAIFLYALSRKH